MLSPLPAGPDQPPESGVADYTASLIAALDVPVTVIAQKRATTPLIGSATVAPTWTPNLAAPFQIRAALDRIKPDVLHVQHEFNLYGGLAQGALLTLLLIWLRRRRCRIVVTVHGVVAPNDVTANFLARNDLPRSQGLARRAFRLSYQGIDAGSDLLIVHHQHFRDILVNHYGVDEPKISVIPHGGPVQAAQPRRTKLDGTRNILCLGFLAGYKQPELLAEVAESGAISNAIFTFGVGTNPRITNRAYHQRSAALEQRVRSLGPLATWLGYVPEEALVPTILSADVLVLPYTECVSVSGIAALAQDMGVPICYSRPLRPLFGAGSLEFPLTPEGLTEAILRSFSASEPSSNAIAEPWRTVAINTQALWERLAGNK